jgi:hypothetical protein
MTTNQFTITLHDSVQQRALRLAELTGHKVEEILPALLELSLSPFSPPIDFDQPVEALTDDEIIALTHLQMHPTQDQRLSELLHQQQSGDLSETENIELQALMRVYEIGMIYKSQALAEAVKRGLQEPLKS